MFVKCHNTVLVTFDIMSFIISATISLLKILDYQMLRMNLTSHKVFYFYYIW